MKAAFTIWDGRIAPVFDVAGQIVVIQRSDPSSTQQCTCLPTGSATEKILFLHQQQIDVLVCGAMTQSTQLIAEAHGIEVLPFIAGCQQEVIKCWLNDQPFEQHFAMPGCNGRCRQTRRRCRRGRGKTDHFKQGES
jgi:predicted Fe-Mo cluster-binding NifX family protein